MRDAWRSGGRWRPLLASVALLPSVLVRAQLYAHLQNTTVASWFNGGVRIFRERPAEGVSSMPTIRCAGGLYILRYTGTVPLD